MEWYYYVAVVGIGLFAGFINTLAGGGSALSLPFLIFLGLPANVANGTNRIAILLQNVVAVREFRKGKALNIKDNLAICLSAVVGSILGAILAVGLNEFWMRRIIGAVLIMMLLLVIFKPNLWIKSQAGKVEEKPLWMNLLIFFVIGAYGGFIQVGVGFFLLAGLVLVNGLDLVRANAVKVLIVFCYTIFALSVFIWNKQVDFKLGLVLALGNMGGAWLGAKFAFKWGAEFIRWVLIIALVFSSARLFGLFEFLF